MHGAADYYTGVRGLMKVLAGERVSWGEAWLRVLADEMVSWGEAWLVRWLAGERLG